MHQSWICQNCSTLGSSSFASSYTWWKGPGLADLALTVPWRIQGSPQGREGDNQCTLPQPLQGCPVTPCSSHSILMWMASWLVKMLVGTLLTPIVLPRGLNALRRYWLPLSFSVVIFQGPDELPHCGYFRGPSGPSLDGVPLHGHPVAFGVLCKPFPGSLAQLGCLSPSSSVAQGGQPKHLCWSIPHSCISSLPAAPPLSWSLLAWYLLPSPWLVQLPCKLGPPPSGLATSHIVSLILVVQPGQCRWHALSSQWLGVAFQLEPQHPPMESPWLLLVASEVPAELPSSGSSLGLVRHGDVLSWTGSQCYMSASMVMLIRTITGEGLGGIGEALSSMTSHLESDCEGAITLLGFSYFLSQLSWPCLISFSSILSQGGQWYILPLSFVAWSTQALLAAPPDQKAHPPSISTTSLASFVLHPSTIR